MKEEPMNELRKKIEERADEHNYEWMKSNNAVRSARLQAKVEALEWVLSLLDEEAYPAEL